MNDNFAFTVTSIKCTMLPGGEGVEFKPKILEKRYKSGEEELADLCRTYFMDDPRQFFCCLRTDQQDFK